MRYFSLSILSLFLSINFSYTQIPVADFSSNTTKGCDILVVTFIDLSTNSPASWIWDFGDSSPTNNNQNPTHVYTSPGIYNVTLTATNASGSNTKTKTSYIKVYKSPTPDFKGNTVSGCEPFVVSFTDLSTSDTTITSWTWDFGDGGNSNSQNPTYTYNTSGTYNVSLFVTDKHNCYNDTTINSYITVFPKPIALFTSTSHQACKPPFTITFKSTSTDTGLTYFWDFGNGNNITTTTDSISYTYNTAGNYNVTLIVTTKNGCKDTIVKNNYVQIGTLQSNFMANITKGCVPLTVNFTDLSSSGVSSWQWDFGDGNPSTQKNPVHVFSNTGTYTIRLITKDNNGCVDTIILPNYITVHPLPNVDFSVDKTIGCKVPFTVNFTDNTPKAVSWQWNFGDSKTSNSRNPSHTYLTIDTFSVSLTVTDSNGCTNTRTKLKLIKIVNEPTADFRASERQACDSLTVKFSDYSFFKNFPLTGWHWDFGDGDTSNIQNPTHTYDTGFFKVSLTVTNTIGCSSTLAITNYIKVGTNPELIDFTVTDTIGCHPFKVYFLGSSVKYADTWIWNFGDGDIAMGGQGIWHTYTDTGYFRVTLIAKNKGCSDTLTKNKYIYVLPPKPLFDVKESIVFYDVTKGARKQFVACDYPITVPFIDNSYGAETWLWYFGDGDTSTLQNPSHIYQNPGYYNVKLVVTNKNGCIDSLTKHHYIIIPETKVGFSQDNLDICRNESITFSDTSKSDTIIINWLWEFGDDSIVDGDFPYPPKHYYYHAGLYPVKLTLKDTLGCIDSITKNITVHELPFPEFTSDTINGCVPLTVSFSDLSNTIDPATMVKWAWDFGDGSTDTIQNPIHIFSDTGQYTVTLTVTDSEGCDSTLTKFNYIHATLPYPDFSCDSITCYSDSVSFTNISVGIGLHFQWDFGDGSPVDTSINPNHLYFVNTTTSFNVSLKATDTNGCYNTIIKTITISRPDAKFGSDSVIADCPPLFTHFFDSSSSNIINWYWNFDDIASGSNNTSTIKNPQHVFNNAGLYDITLIVTNMYGCKDTIVKPDYIFVDGPSGTFDFYPKNGCAPLTVTFVAHAKNTETYYWIFGDGNSTTGDSVIHTYTYGTSYRPILIIEDSINIATGDTVPCTKTIMADDSVRLISADVEFDVDYDSTCIYSTLRFRDLSVANLNIDSWLWDFGDGNTSNSLSPTHSYNTAGVYDITLTITIDTCSFTLTKTQFLHIFNPPAADFSCETVSFFVNDRIPFIDLSTGVNLSSWYWDFDDGEISSDRNTYHRYYTPGFYEVMLIVSSYDNCSDTAYCTIEVIDILEIPNVFTPNGDGVNDFFDIPEREFGEYHLVILNRWGEEVFSTNTPETEWDGTTNGLPAAASTYYYVLETRSKFGAAFQQKGFVTLIR